MNEHDKPAADAAAAGGQEPSPAAELTDADMPPIDSLNGDSDLKPFLAGGVSDGLKRRAFRKIFLGERFNIRDGLDDYDDDFTRFAALGDIVTAEARRWRERMEKTRRDDDAPAADDDAPAAEADAEPSADAAAVPDEKDETPAAKEEEHAERQ